MSKKVDIGGIKWGRILVVLIAVGVLIYGAFWYFGYENCKDMACFEENLRACDRAKFVAGDDMIFEYFVMGKSGGSCEIEVELLQGELNNADSQKLEGQIMVCEIPLGAVVMPESDIGVCHGLLKEGLQDLVIRKLHTYLVQNLGRLNLEMAGLPS